MIIFSLLLFFISFWTICVYENRTTDFHLWLFYTIISLLNWTNFWCNLIFEKVNILISVILCWSNFFTDVPTRISLYQKVSLWRGIILTLNKPVTHCHSPPAKYIILFVFSKINLYSGMGLFSSIIVGRSLEPMRSILA